MSNLRFNNILVVSPHTDDGELGAGGFIAKQIREGAKVTFLTFCIAEDSVPEGFPCNILETEAKDSAFSFGLTADDIVIHKYPVRRLCEYRQEILEILVKYRKNEYDLVLCPSSKDIHQDHSTIYNEVVRAYKNTCVLGYDLPWNNLLDDQVFFAEISEDDLQAKYRALQCYKSQSFRNYTSYEFLKSLATIRGAVVSKKYAEKFEVIRFVVS